MEFEGLQPIFRKVDAEWENPTASDLPTLLPFLFHVHALDSKHLRILVTDFQSFTWESVKSIPQLEDLREDVGLGGSWSEFINYLMDSIKSDNVKLVLGGAKFAKLVAAKTKGMPLVTIHLERLIDSSASDAITYLSWEIFKAFRSGQELLVKEQQRSFELTEKLCAETEKNESIQDQLRLALPSKRQRLSRSTESPKSSPIAAPLIDLDTMTVSDMPNSPGKTHKATPLTKGSSLVPAYCRTKPRGFSLDNAEDGDCI